MRHFILPLVIVLALVLFSFAPVRGATTPGQDPVPATEQRTVLITGASSGIGRRTAEVLAENGFYVYAGARKDEDMKALNELKNVEAVRLDVTEDDQIAAAVRRIEEGGRGLDALINNAGVLVIAPLIEVTEEDLAFQMDVNVWGPYRVTKAFAPLLVESEGHVLTTGSISGFLSWRFGGPYCMSKHAVEAFSDVLHTELEPFGVRVSVIEPGNFKSDIMANMVERMKSRGYGGEGSLYEGNLDRMLSGPTDLGQYDEPDAVAETFLAELNDENPKRRYMVTPNANEAEVTIRAALRRVAELNEGHPFSFDAETLHGMLDDELGR